MKPLWTPASLFTRKVYAAALELELWQCIEIVPTAWPLEWGHATVDFAPYRPRLTVW